MVKYALDSGIGGIRFRQLFLCCEIFNVSEMLDVKLLSESKFFFLTQISIRKLGHLYPSIFIHKHFGWESGEQRFSRKFIEFVEHKTKVMLLNSKTMVELELVIFFRFFAFNFCVGFFLFMPLLLLLCAFIRIENVVDNCVSCVARRKTGKKSMVVSHTVQSGLLPLQPKRTQRTGTFNKRSESFGYKSTVIMLSILASSKL